MSEVSEEVARAELSHARSGLLTRTRWELGLATAARPPELLGGDAWLYPEARVVVLVDLRRGSLVWSEHALHVLDCVLSSVGTGPSVGASASRRSWAFPRTGPGAAPVGGMALLLEVSGPAARVGALAGVLNFRLRKERRLGAGFLAFAALFAGV